MYGLYKDVNNQKFTLKAYGPDKVLKVWDLNRVAIISVRQAKLLVSYSIKLSLALMFSIGAQADNIEDAHKLCAHLKIGSERYELCLDYAQDMLGHGEDIKLVQAEINSERGVK